MRESSSSKWRTANDKRAVIQQMTTIAVVRLEMIR
jgi:hypothetical protein